MNVKKIIKGIVGLGAMAGAAYAAYKLGESNGKINERFREKYGDDEDDIELDDNEDEFRFYDNYDEPDDACLAPKTENKPSFSVSLLRLILLRLRAFRRKIWICLFTIFRLTSTPPTNRFMSGLRLTRIPLQRLSLHSERQDISGTSIPVNITTEVYFRLRSYNNSK